jgi:serine/threonine-protein kinase
MGAPALIGRYEIVAELGRGAMGSVYKALDPAVGRTVALKTIHAAALSGEHAAEYRTRFEREARASGVLAHPAIVPVFDVGEHEGAPFLVMEFVEGRTLDSAMKSGERFTLDRVCEIGQQLAEALGYAHRQGVIHRDIKPANILLTSREVYGSERPRITDFGIAKLAQSELTTTGQLLGTPAFMPPEQFTGAPIDGRADLFSLGVILYALATGDQPFPGETMTAVSYKIVHTDPVHPSKLNPSIPAGLESVLLKCLSKSPAGRYQTGEALAQDLATLRANPNATTLLANAPSGDPNATLAIGSGSSQLAGQTAAAKKPSGPVKRELLAAAALTAVAAACVGGWFLFRHYHPNSAPQHQASVVVPAQQTPANAPLQVVQGSVLQQPQPAAKPVPAKPATAASKTPAPANPSAQPAAKPSASTPAQPPQAQPAPSAKSAAPAPVAFDPRKLDPNANSKFKIELNHMPNGVPIVVTMNKALLLRFISGDKTNLDGLFIPPGVQQFRVTVQNGSQQVVSNIVSSEFKAKKRKVLKIELRNQGYVSPGSPAPLSAAAQIVLTLSSPLL